MDTQTENNVAQANITYSLVLKTELGKQLSGLTLRLVNALTGLAQENTFAKIIAKLDQDLEAEKKAVECIFQWIPAGKCKTNRLPKTMIPARECNGNRQDFLKNWNS